MEKQKGIILIIVLSVFSNVIYAQNQYLGFDDFIFISINFELLNNEFAENLKNDSIYSNLMRKFLFNFELLLENNLQDNDFVYLKQTYDNLIDYHISEAFENIFDSIGWNNGYKRYLTIVFGMMYFESREYYANIHDEIIRENIHNKILEMFNKNDLDLIELFGNLGL